MTGAERNVITVEQRVAELLAVAPPITDIQREGAVRLLATPRPAVRVPSVRRRAA